MADRSTELSLLIIIAGHLLFATLVLALARGWMLGRWQSGAVWSAVAFTLAGTVPVIFIEHLILSFLIGLLQDQTSGIFAAIFVVVFIEEALKLVAVVFTLLLFRRNLAASPGMLLALGAAAGLALGMAENYVFLSAISSRMPDMLERIAAIRAVGPLPMHIVCGLVMAWYLAHRNEGGGRRWLRGLLAAGGLHLFFNAAQIGGAMAGKSPIPLASTAHIVAFSIAVLAVALAGWRVLAAAARDPALKPMPGPADQPAMPAAPGRTPEGGDRTNRSWGSQGRNEPPPNPDGPVIDRGGRRET